MLSHVRRILPALLLALVLPLSLSACGGGSGEDKAGGAGGSEGRPCDHGTNPELTVLSGSEDTGAASVVSTARNTVLLAGTAKSGGPASCLLPELLELLSP